MRTLMLLTAVTMVLWFMEFTSASYLVFDSTPSTILPILTNTLTIRCAIKNGSLPLKRQLHGGLDIEQPELRTTTPAAQADVVHVVSIVIRKLNTMTMQNEAVANVTPYDTPVAEGQFVNVVKVEGSTEASPGSNEQAYLQVTWENPLEEQGGSYSCEAMTLTADRHPTPLSKTFEVSVTEPSISDLVKYVAAHETTIADHKKYIAELQRENQELKDGMHILKLKVDLQINESRTLRDDFENFHSNISNQTSELNRRMDNAKGQNIQSGFDICKNQYIQFHTAYKTKPTVLTTFIRIGFTLTSASTDEPYIFQVNPEQVTVTGFNASCISTGSSTIGDFMWLALDS